MCGIVGFIDFSSQSSESLLLEVTNTLSHRGPDGVGTHFFKKDTTQIGLDHRRIAILELSEKGKQPMQFGSYWITFNGEIYNFKSIKLELETLGHTFLSDSDTEVILHAYQEWDEKALSKFIGMFAFCIFNEDNDKFLLPETEPE